MKVTAQVVGLKEIENALAKLEKTSTRKTAARNALKKAAEPIVSAMAVGAAGTPNPEISTAIVSTWRAPKGEAGNAAYAKVMRETRGLDRETALSAMRDARRAVKGTLPPVLWYVGPSADFSFSHWWEFGIAPHINGGMFAGTKHPGVKATPFIRPAWDENKAEALEIMRVELRKEIGKALMRQVKRKHRAAGGKV